MSVLTTFIVKKIQTWTEPKSGKDEQNRTVSSESLVNKWTIVYWNDWNTLLLQVALLYFLENANFNIKSCLLISRERMKLKLCKAYKEKPWSGRGVVAYTYF